MSQFRSIYGAGFFIITPWSQANYEMLSKIHINKSASVCINFAINNTGTRRLGTIDPCSYNKSAACSEWLIKQ